MPPRPNLMEFPSICFDNELSSTTSTTMWKILGSDCDQLASSLSLLEQYASVDALEKTMSMSSVVNVGRSNGSVRRSNSFDSTITNSSSGASSNCSNVNSNDHFPWKLHTMLEAAEGEDFQHIVSWVRGGKAFKVHDPEKFVEVVLRKYFIGQTRYKSFQRQLNIYGFKRVTRGPEKGVCYHELFLRGFKELCYRMDRQKLKPDKCQEAEAIVLSNVEIEQTSVEKILSSSGVTVSDDAPSTSDGLDEATLSIFDELFGKTFYPVEEDQKDRSLTRLVSVEPEVAKSSSLLLDSADDVESTTNVSANTNTTNTTKRSQESFPWKVHDMLRQVKLNNQEHIVSWDFNGRALKVHDPQAFASEILPAYFLHSTKWESFQRQLNLYGFTRISRGPQKGMYLHKYFVRDNRSLCRLITRSK